MTNKEMNAEIISDAKGYVPYFSAALLRAANEHDEKRLAELGVIAQRLYKKLSNYMDQLNPTDLDPEIVVLADYFRENAEEIELALQREPAEDSEGEEWKPGEG
jgi:hypothetical protein